MNLLSRSSSSECCDDSAVHVNVSSLHHKNPSERVVGTQKEKQHIYITSHSDVVRKGLLKVLAHRLTMSHLNIHLWYLLQTRAFRFWSCTVGFFFKSLECRWTNGWSHWVTYLKLLDNARYCVAPAFASCGQPFLTGSEVAQMGLERETIFDLHVKIHWVVLLNVLFLIKIKFLASNTLAAFHWKQASLYTKKKKLLHQTWF